MATCFRIKYGLIFALLSFCFKGSDTQCSSSNHFGPNCDFECHCMNNEQCNSTTGICPSGCDFAWVGPGCQRNNIVPAGQMNGREMVVRQQSNIPQRRIAALAVDRDLSTCSQTYYANMSTYIPWWRLWLKDKYKIRNISIVTSKESLDYFQNFEVMVENQTFNGRYGNSFTGQEMCYKHNNSSPITTNIDVTCNKPIFGNQLRIRLAINGSQLVLCDVRIYGECPNITFGTSCTEKCSTHCEDVCDKDYGTCASCSPGWTGIRCNQQVCKDGNYGENCKFNCSGNCKNSGVCRKTDGLCVDGCSPGFDGEKCDQTCTDGYYGHMCLQKCSANCAGGYSNCNNVYGSCMSGCKAGWRGRKCDEECPTGSWGLNCANSCGYCMSKVCRHTDGICNGDCAAGFKQTPHCDEECDSGRYGINCSRICSKNCKDICRKQSGECQFCKSGWHGANCTLECEDGRWGENCERRCFTCVNETCNRINGACYSQCKPGFKQTEYCDQECENRSYGLNCSKMCSTNCKDICDRRNGYCTSCKSGWYGERCTRECTNGRWGENCKQVCTKCHNQTCDRFNGTCNVQDKQGFKQTEYCDQESNMNVETENDYDIIKRKSGVEHIYEQQ
ncbi:platelet endothelial aggregation receptor 1-like isoform X2 [Mercenaria mercenaria]|uniref:platelet endothelial aggregation receptor 1-like isoform X2 n=1 Tax=Mercenaria mercenaria TaxID=6596 RepID=UPI00234F5EAA|nr:platelet endothelial aggregation receptor 1-like isoform X2 [Mercenaria mercenaria]